MSWEEMALPSGVQMKESIAQERVEKPRDAEQTEAGGTGRTLP